MPADVQKNGADASFVACDVETLSHRSGGVTLALWSVSNAPLQPLGGEDRYRFVDCTNWVGLKVVLSQRVMYATVANVRADVSTPEMDRALWRLLDWNEMVSHQPGGLITKFCPKLNGVQETMLWSLHERVCESKRTDGVLPDPYAIRIYDGIDYDFEGTFGITSRLAAARAAKFDQVLRRWLLRNPFGTIVSLGEGLETQAFRVDNGTMRWLSVDLPDAIELREQFIEPTDRFRHLAMSALDVDWMEHIDRRSGVFIVAQGLLMYFDPQTAHDLFVAIARRFAGEELMFDLLPREVPPAMPQGNTDPSAYTPPAMPWRLNRNEVAATLRSWQPDLRMITCTRYRLPGPRPAIVEDILDAVLPRRQRRPSVAHVSL
jgi:O-methyltransferase involved in polyketide biosynthesis